MKKQTILCALAFLLGLMTASAQVDKIQNVNFECNNQSIFNSGPALVLADTFYMLKDNGKEAAFFVNASTDGTPVDPNGNDMPGIDIINKFGIEFDLYARYSINSGSTNIDYPTKVKFTYPSNQSFGCGEEVTVNTSYTVEPNYKMEISDPGAEFAIGSEFNAGIFLGGRACGLECTPPPIVCNTVCHPFSGTIDEGVPSFENANENNYRNYLVPGFYDFVRVSTSDGIQFPWDLYGMPNPGVPDLTLPLNTANIPGFEDLTKISGTVDNPMKELDAPDNLMNTAIVNNSSFHFMHMEFDPLQFQEYFTHIPLKFSGDIGPAHFELAILSVPLIFDGYMVSEFKFDPVLNTSLDLGREVSWKEMNGATIVQSGTSQIINNFKLGNTLKLTVPDNQPLTIKPNVSIKNTFKTNLKLKFDASLAIRVFTGKFEVGDIETPIEGVNKSFPLGTFYLPVFEKTFPMGGFQDQELDPVILKPDNTPPVLITKNNVAFIPDAGGSVSVSPQDLVGVAYDVAGGTIRYLSATPNTFDCSNLGNNTVQVTIDDSRCNSTTAPATLVVVDRTKPSVVCKPFTIYLDNNGAGTVTPNDVFASGFDNCGVVNLVSLSKTAFDCSNIGPNNTTVLTVNDGHGNNNTCTATITVVDNIKPTVVCKPATIYLNNSGVAALSPAEVFQSGADNCGVVNLESVVPNLFFCSSIGANTATLTINDSHGNTATCNAAITVLDKIAPNVFCKSATVDLNNLGAGSITTGSVFLNGNDNCGVVNQESVVPSNFNCDNLGANTVVLTVNDSHGNTNTCTATVTVRDLIKPVVTCPANIVSNNDPGICGASVSFSASATDNCTIASLIPVPASGSLFNVGTTSVRFTATDVAGNTATCNFNVTIRDTEKPVITCPDNILRENDLGLCSAVTTYPDATATDNCAVQSVVRTSGQVSGFAFPVGISYLSYRATDIYGNSSTCSFSIEVRDTEAPKITCPANLTKPNDFGHCGRHMEYIGTASNFSDNCGIDRIFNDNPVDFSIGETAVTWTALDIHGNTTTCIQTVKVFDNEWPVITCPQNIKTTTDEGYCEALEVNFNATATDNCPGVLVEYDFPPKTAFPIGYTNIEATATDVYGHAVKCQFQVIIEGRKEVCNGIDDDCDGFTDELQDWAQIIKTSSSNVGQGDQYGASVAIWGDWAIVGMNEKPQTSGATLGAAFILHRSANDPSNWQEIAKLQHNNQPGEGFGSSVAIGEGWAAVGAYNGNGAASGAGAVYIFKQNPDQPETWNWLKTIYADDANAGDNFGRSLALNGDRLLVGAPLDDQAADNAGAAYLFGKNTGGNENWGQIKKLMAINASANDNLGGSVAIDGTNALVGAVGDDQKGLNAGAAFLFNENQGWGQVSKLMANSGAAGDNFGVSVGISGGYAIVGASMDDDKAANAGTAFIFQKKALGWQQSTILFDYNGTNNDEFGHAVTIWGDYAIVGARKNDSKGISAGACFVYHREDGGWVLFSQITDGQGKTNDQFGSAVALYSTTLIAGAPFDDDAGKTDRGSASIFEGICSPSDDLKGADERETIDASGITAFNLAPNPTSSATTVIFQLPAEQAFVIRLFNMEGRMVYSHEGIGIVGENNLPLPLTGILPGVYLVDFNTEGSSFQRKLVVQQ